MEPIKPRYPAPVVVIEAIVFFSRPLTFLCVVIHLSILLLRPTLSDDVQNILIALSFLGVFLAVATGGEREIELGHRDGPRPDEVGTSGRYWTNLLIYTVLVVYFISWQLNWITFGMEERTAHTAGYLAVGASTYAVAAHLGRIVLAQRRASVLKMSSAPVEQ